MSFTRRGLLLGGLVLAGGLAGPPARAWAAEEGPPIIECDGWGARANSDIVPVVGRPPVKIIVHHTASPNVEDLSREAAARLARGIQNFHMDRRGWLDSGQQFTISRGGFVLEGRRRSVQVLRGGRQHVVGAHCTGQNAVAVGIENEGIYLDVGPTQVLWERLREMCGYICQQYRITPTEIYGHRDFRDTACPGDVLYAMLPQLRSEVAGALGQHVERSGSRPSWPLLRTGDRGPVVRAAQHLLRAAGHPEVSADGQFGPGTADAVRRFQSARRTEEVNGMVGGESWPLLATTVHSGQEGEAARAVAVLVEGSASRAPSLVGPAQWQQLLTAAAG